jgi:polar amino acid transport system substrate-binding protein
MGGFRAAGAVRRLAILVAVLMIASTVAACGSTATPAPTTAAPATTWEQVQADKSITWGVANEPPLTVWPSDDAAVTGQGPEEIRAVFNALGITDFKPVRVEFSGLIPGLQAKRFDVIANGLTIREARCEQVAFSNPFFIGVQGLAVKKGNPLNLHSMGDIAKDPNIKVGVLQGAIEIDFLKAAGVPDGQVLKFPDNSAVFTALQTGRVDAVQMEAAPMLYEMAGLNDPNLEQALPFEGPKDADGNPIVSYQAVAFRKEDTDMRDAFNVELAKALASGALLKAAEPFYATAANMPPADVKTNDLCPGGN